MRKRLRQFAVMLCLLWATAATAEWKFVETENFRIYAQDSAQALIETAHLMEDFHKLLEDSTGRRLHPQAGPLDIFIVEEIAQTNPWQATDPRLGGYYRTSIGRMGAFATRPKSASVNDPHGLQVLFHEYAHHFLMGAGAWAYPLWYQEGFAEYYAGTIFHDDYIEIGRPRPGHQALLTRGQWLPAIEILAPIPQQGHRAFNQFYAQSWLWTHYFLNEPDKRPLLASYLKAVGQGADAVAAFAQHIAPDSRRFQAELQAYAKRSRFTRLARGMVERPRLSVQTLTPAANKLLMAHVELEYGNPHRLGATYLADVRAIAAEYPDDPFAMRSLAWAEYRAGHYLAAARLTENLLQTRPTDPDILRLHALSLWGGGSQTVRTVSAAAQGTPAQAALAHVRQALVQSPDDWRLLSLYARLRQPHIAPLPQDALEAVLRAYNIAPQVAELAQHAAIALVMADRVPEAASILQAMGWGAYTNAGNGLATRLLAASQNGDKAEMLRIIYRN